MEDPGTISIIGNTFVQKVDMHLGAVVSEIVAALVAEGKASAERVSVLRSLVSHMDDTRRDVSLVGPLLHVTPDTASMKNQHKVDEVKDHG